MIRIIKPEARGVLASRLKERDLIITDEGRLFWVAFVDKRRSGSFHSYHVTAHAEYDFKREGWYKTDPGTQIHPLFATADADEEAIDFAREVREHADMKRREIERLETQFMVAVRMLADEIVDKID